MLTGAGVVPAGVGALVCFRVLVDKYLCAVVAHILSSNAWQGHVGDHS
jgi:hypothetical protein